MSQAFAQDYRGSHPSVVTPFFNENDQVFVTDLNNPNKKKNENDFNNKSMYAIESRISLYNLNPSDEKITGTCTKFDNSITGVSDLFIPDCNFKNLYFKEDGSSFTDKGAFGGVHTGGENSVFCKSGCGAIKVVSDDKIFKYKEELKKKYKQLKYKNWLEKQKRINNRLAFYFGHRSHDKISKGSREKLAQLRGACHDEINDGLIAKASNKIATKIINSITTTSGKDLIANVEKTGCDYITNIVNGNNVEKSEVTDRINDLAQGTFGQALTFEKKKESLKAELKNEILKLFTEQQNEMSLAIKDTYKQDLENNESATRFCMDQIHGKKGGSIQSAKIDPQIKQRLESLGIKNPQDQQLFAFFNAGSIGQGIDFEKLVNKLNIAQQSNGQLSEKDYLELSIESEFKNIKNECNELKNEDMETIFCSDEGEPDLNEPVLMASLDPDFALCFSAANSIESETCQKYAALTCKTFDEDKHIIDTSHVKQTMLKKELEISKTACKEDARKAKDNCLANAKKEKEKCEGLKNDERKTCRNLAEDKIKECKDVKRDEIANCRKVDQTEREMKQNAYARNKSKGKKRNSESAGFDYSKNISTNLKETIEYDKRLTPHIYDDQFLKESAGDVNTCQQKISSAWKVSKDGSCKALQQSTYSFASYAESLRNCFEHIIYQPGSSSSDNNSVYTPVDLNDVADSGEDDGQEEDDSEDEGGPSHGNRFVMFPNNSNDTVQNNSAIQNAGTKATNEENGNFLDKLNIKNNQTQTIQNSINEKKFQIQNEQKVVEKLKKQPQTPEISKEIDSRQKRIDRLKEETQALEEKLADLKTKKDKDSYQTLMDEIKGLKQQNEEMNKKLNQGQNTIVSQANSNSAPSNTGNSVVSSSTSFANGSNSKTLEDQHLTPTPVAGNGNRGNSGSNMNSDFDLGGSSVGKNSKDVLQVSKVEGTSQTSGFRLISEGDKVASTIPVVESVPLATIQNIKSGKINDDILKEIMKACEASVKNKAQCESSNEVVLIYKVNDKEEKMLVDLSKIKDSKKIRKIASEPKEDNKGLKKERKQKYFVEELNNIIGGSSNKK